MVAKESALNVDGESILGRLNHPGEDTDLGRLMLPGAGHGPYGDIFDRHAGCSHARCQSGFVIGGLCVRPGL